jgi:triacylglycerol esterase/lipase EstA (alpha/beta hydrolase family)
MIARAFPLSSLPFFGLSCLFFSAWDLYLGSSLAALGSLKILNWKADLFPRPIQTAVRWTHSTLFDVLIFLATLPLRPFAYLPIQKKPAGPSTGQPILLVHGYLYDSSGFIYLKYALAKAGLGPVYTLNFHSPFRSILDYAEMVQKKAKEIEAATGRSDLILIGHSMGGLVSAAYADRFAPPGTITDLITIGSPLGGTHVANIALGKNGREMRLSSPLLKEIVSFIRNSLSIRFFHIGTKTDQLVIPSTSSWVGEHPEREYILDDIGHMALLFSPRVKTQIAEWLSPN